MTQRKVTLGVISKDETFEAEIVANLGASERKTSKVTRSKLSRDVHCVEINSGENLSRKKSTFVCNMEGNPRVSFSTTRKNYQQLLDNRRRNDENERFWGKIEIKATKFGPNFGENMIKHEDCLQ